MGGGSSYTGRPVNNGDELEFIAFELVLAACEVCSDVLANPSDL